MAFTNTRPPATCAAISTMALDSTKGSSSSATSFLADSSLHAFNANGRATLAKNTSRPPISKIRDGLALQNHGGEDLVGVLDSRKKTLVLGRQVSETAHGLFEKRFAAHDDDH